MAAIGIAVSHAVEQPEPRQATAEEASLLGIRKAALVTHIRRTYYSDQGRPVETADIVVPSAHCLRNMTGRGTQTVSAESTSGGHLIWRVCGSR